MSIEAKGSSKCEATTINAGVSAMSQLSSNDVIFLPHPGAGRPYDVTPMRSIFKADGVETDERYSVSEWWLEAGQPGPGPHSHEANEEIFYVVEGTMSFLVDSEWLERPAALSCASPRARPMTSRIEATPAPAC